MSAQRCVVPLRSSAQQRPCRRVQSRGGADSRAVHHGPHSAAADDCATFSETGHQVCGRFLDYWQTHGGLAQLTDPFMEVNPTNGQPYTVQYFERARFEYHPENANSPYVILLGILGREQFLAKYPNGAPGSTSPPPPPPAPDNFQVAASVSNAAPTQNSTVRVTAVLTNNGPGVAGATMDTVWHYKTTTSSCSGGPSGSDGRMSCSRSISRATPGYTVPIDVIVHYNGQDFTTSTSFMPQ